MEGLKTEMHFNVGDASGYPHLANQQRTAAAGQFTLDPNLLLLGAGGKLPTALLPDLSFPELALDSHLIGGSASGPPPGGGAAYGLQLAQLDNLQSLLQQSGGQLGAGSNAFLYTPRNGATLRAALPGTSADNPLQSVVIGKASAPVPQQAQQQTQQQQTYHHQQQQQQLAPPPVSTPAAAAVGGNSMAPSPPGSNGLMQGGHFGLLPLLNPAGGLGGGFNERQGMGGGGREEVGNGGGGRPGRRNSGEPRGPRAPRGDKPERSSKYRGVTKHRRSGRFEAHIWVKDMGRQVYLGGYECEEHAAEAYDIAALKSKGRRTKTNFELAKYEDLLGCIDRMSMEELVMAVRRQSQGFSRGTSSFRGVTHHPSGRWEARIGVPGSKHVYLGLFTDEKEAARSYDRALVRLRGRAAATNFALSDYRTEMADYHRMQGRMLHNDARFAEISSSGTQFERWVKLGCEGFPDLASPDAAANAAAAAALAAGPLQDPDEAQQAEQGDQQLHLQLQPQAQPRSPTPLAQVQEQLLQAQLAAQAQALQVQALQLQNEALEEMLIDTARPQEEQREQAQERQELQQQ